MQIVVSGVGVVSALGVGVEAHLEAIRAGRSGISKEPSVLRTTHRLPVGELRLTNDALKERLGLPADQTVSRTALLGALAVREALADAGLQPHGRVGLVSATSVGGMDLTEHFFAPFMADDRSGRLRAVKMHDCAASTEWIAAQCGITGYRTTISTACSSAANALMTGARLIRHGVVDCCVVGGTDALSAFTLNGFKSLMILDSEPCRPFDEGRAGLNLGEGAGYLVLQRAEEVENPYCTLAGYANRNDAHHQTASSEQGNGAFLAMQEALQVAGVEPDAVSYVNVHGTGTANNDRSEGVAMRRLFGDRVPPFSSTKGFTGHTLAAAGGVEAVFSALMMRHGMIFPNLHFTTPIAELGLTPVQELREGVDLRCVVSNSFGFGGNCSSVVFTK